MLYDKKWDLPVTAPAKPKLKGWQKVLLGAADLIEQKGWIQGDYGTQYGYCAMGAILHTKGNWFSKWRARKHLMAAIRDGYRVYRVSCDAHTLITRWNDVLFQDKQTVVETIRAAAK